MDWLVAASKLHKHSGTCNFGSEIEILKARKTDEEIAGFKDYVVHPTVKASQKGYTYCRFVDTV